jgi:hypothetical protein
VELINFVKNTFKETAITLVTGVVVFALILVTTLNLTLAAVTLLLFISVAVFQKSFSRGWLFLFLIVIMFPSVKITPNVTTISDLLLMLLAFIGLVSILFENVKVSLNKLTFYFILLLISGASIVFFGNYFRVEIDPSVWSLSFSILFYWLALTTFHYYFQTQKRLKRFFSIIITAGVAHSFFGIIAYLSSWQTAGGLGISTGQVQNIIFSSVKYQINGFLGDGFILRVGANALAPLLLISIPVTIGMFLNAKKRSARTRPLSLIEEKARLFDSAYSIERANFIKEKLIQKIKESFMRENFSKFLRSKTMLVFLLMLQLVGLMLTFSYIALVALGVGLFIAGILLRNRRLISIIAAILIILTLVLPAFRPATSTQRDGLQNWFSGFEQIQQNFVWGSGWKVDKENQIGNEERIHNSYLVIWNNFGLIGITIFLGALYQYFKDLREVYIRSDGPKRIWLIMIIAIYFEFLLMGLTNNTLLFGPAALVFWVLYGAVLNLKKRQIIFGLTETKLAN